MGYFFTNLHVRAPANAAVAAARALHLVPLFLVERGGWTTLYPQPLEEPGAKLLDVTKQLSAITRAPVFAFDVHDSDVFRYVLAHEGTKQDDYTSNPAGYGAGGRSSPRGGDRAALVPHVAHLTEQDSATLDRMLATGQLKPVVTRQEREQRSKIARRISELSRAGAPDAKAEAERLRAESSSWYPRTGFEDRPDNAEELAVFLGRLLGLERARITNGWRSLWWGRAHPEWSRRGDEVIDVERID